MSVNVTARQEKLAGLVRSATVIPVLTIERLEHAVQLARALVAGGVRMLEVTLRTPVAIEAAKAMIAEVPDAIVGIGTILNPDDLKRAEALTKPVVDTTAAGDSFAAAYLAARLAGAEPVEAARAGHALAGVVVCHPGAIIPRTAMPAIQGEATP